MSERTFRDAETAYNQPQPCLQLRVLLAAKTTEAPRREPLATVPPSGAALDADWLSSTAPEGIQADRRVA